ncbi:DUF262 domain-containing protein [Luedemannella flava]|uniref:DUF262 domain-containing protein n=1 Tax=Luedemannella flava TaxID=349316 RepID=A0ABP4YZ91_9ACTN
MSGGAIERIDGQAWTIRQLFSGRRYGLDNYQREFAWEKEHLKELLTDLSERFLDRWRSDHEPSEVVNYPPYFLGPIVTHVRQTNALIVDGQQRLTVLMLLLMWLNELQADRDDAVAGIEPLIVFDLFGQRRFAVEPEDDYDERRACLTALMTGADVDPTQLTSRSNRTLVARYHDLDDLFPDALRGDALPAFIYWLLDRVHLVEISTASGPLALETFETMNDRGLRLNPIDLLKSFVLSKVGVADQGNVNRTWRARMTALTEADNNAHVGFMRTWLRARYSRTAADDTDISKSFDKWVRREHANVGVRYPGEFITFVAEMDRLSRRYVDLLSAAKEPQAGLDVVYANGRNSVTLQLPLILATLTPDDDAATFARKARMVGGYLDIVVARRMVNWRDYGYDAMASGVFSLAREIRGLDVDTLAKRLGDEVASLPETFDAVGAYGLRARNHTRVRYLLARMTAWLEIQHDGITTEPAFGPLLKKFMSYEIEHIWANKPELQPQVKPRQFDQFRNSFGGLLLLTKPFNAAYGAKPYADKVDQYWGQGTMLAKSLHPECYRLNPGFRKVIEHYDLPFRAYESAFDEHAIAQRQALYQRLCHLVWDPAQYGLAVAAPMVRHRTERTRAHFGISISRLMERGFIPPEAALVGTFRDLDYHARVTHDGQIRLDSGELFDSPSSAAGGALNRGSWNGWTFWRVALPDGSNPTLNAVRRTALKSGLTP